MLNEHRLSHTWDAYGDQDDDPRLLLHRRSFLFGYRSFLLRNRCLFLWLWDRSLGFLGGNFLFRCYCLGPKSEHLLG